MDMSVKKYLFFIPLIICLGFSLFFYHLFSAERDAAVKNALDNKVALLGMVVSAMNNLENMDNQAGVTNTNWLVSTMEALDKEPNSLGLLADENLQVLTMRFSSYENKYATFGLFDNKTLSSTVLTQESGYIQISYSKNELSLYFRWVSDKSTDQRYLLMVGIVPADVSSLDIEYIYGAGLLILITVACNYIMIFYTLRISSHTKSEQGR